MFQAWPNHTFNRTLRGVPSLGQNSSPNSARRKVPVNFYVRPQNTKSPTSCSFRSLPRSKHGDRFCARFAPRITHLAGPEGPRRRPGRTGHAPRLPAPRSGDLTGASAKFFIRSLVLLASAWPKSNKCDTNQRVRGIIRGRRISIQGIEVIVRLLLVVDFIDAA